MKVWFDDPQQLVRTDKISQFWPTSEQTPEDRINAASRFVIYASCLIYIIRRDPRIFIRERDSIIRYICSLSVQNGHRNTWKYSWRCVMPNAHRKQSHG